MALERYQNLSKEEKKTITGFKRYTNLLESEKQKVVECRKRFLKIHKP